MLRVRCAMHGADVCDQAKAEVCEQKVARAMCGKFENINQVWAPRPRARCAIPGTDKACGATPGVRLVRGREA